MIDIRYTYPFLRRQTLRAHRANYFDSHALKIEHFANCYGLPYKALNNGDINIIGGGLDTLGGYNIGTLYECDYLSSRKKVEEDVLFVGHISSVCWGHTITDSIARLWYVVSQSDEGKYDNLQIYYISEAPLEGNYLDFIKLLGIRVERMHRIDEITKFKSVFVPDACFDNHRVSLRYSMEYVKLINLAIQRAVCGQSPKKVLLMRENSLRQVCSKDVFDILENLGYVTIHPEKLSISSQINIFQNAEIIVSEESSLSHNFIFCKEGSKVVLLRKANTINIYQSLINKLRKLNVTYIDCHLSLYINQPHRGPFFLYANENFCKFFKQMPRAFPYQEFYQYLTNECGSDIWESTHNMDMNYKPIIKEIISNQQKEIPIIVE